MSRFNRFVKCQLVMTAALSVLALSCIQTPSKDAAQTVVQSDEPAAQNKSDTSAEDQIPTPEIPPPLSDKSAEKFLTAYGSRVKTSLVTMRTGWGDVVIRLFDDVPLHRANFLYLVERGYYSPSQIVRIVPDFIIQGGNSEEREDQLNRALIGDHTLPAEFRSHRIHKRGAVAMSRSYTDNPTKRSSAYDFYIVIGKPVNGPTLHTTAMGNGMAYTDAQKEVYATIGGAPHLDNEHTVFGEVISGMDVVQTLSRLDRDASDWPIQQIEFNLELGD